MTLHGFFLPGAVTGSHVGPRRCHTCCAMRRAGLSIDVLPPDGRDLGPCSLVMAPGLLDLSPEFRDALETCAGRIILGPRAGQKPSEL